MQILYFTPNHDHGENSETAASARAVSTHEAFYYSGISMDKAPQPASTLAKQIIKTKRHASVFNHQLVAKQIS